MGGGNFGVFSCFDGCFGALMGYPSNAAQDSMQYSQPRPLDPLEPCTPWGKLSPERRSGIKHVEVASCPKESSQGWVNQDATTACGPPGCDASAGDGDAAAGTTSDGSMIFCVFDGHGKYGHEVAAVAADRLPSHLAAFPGGPLSSPKKALEAAFRKTDDDIYSALGARVEYSGSTGVVVLVDMVNRALHIGNVGDSRAILAQNSPDSKSPRWSALALTSDLTPDLPDEKERIELSGGCVMALEGDDGEDVGPARVWDSAAREKPGLAVSRSLGDGASRCLGVTAEPVVTKHLLRPQDRFMLIATDGLWDTLGNDQAVRMAAKYLDRNLHQVALKALFEAVRRGEGGQLVDDTTAILVSF